MVVVGVLVIVIATLFSRMGQVPESDVRDCSVLAGRFDSAIHKYGFCIDYLEGRVGEYWVGGKLLGVNQTITYPGSNVTYALEFEGENEKGWVYVILTDKDYPLELGSFYRFDLMQNCKYMKVLATEYYPPYIPLFYAPEKLEC